MLQHHYMKDGNSILIAQMSTLHLLRTVRLKLSHIADNCGIMLHGNDEVQKMSEMHQRAYCVNVSPQGGAESLKRELPDVYPYLAELWFRWISAEETNESVTNGEAVIVEDIQAQLKVLLGRAGKLNAFGKTGTLLPSETISDEDEDDDELFDKHVPF